MGKNEYMMDNGKQQRLLHPLEAEKRAKKQRLVKQNEEERRKRKFSEALETDPESIKRKVLAMERQDKMGTLSIRQRVEKKEMKDLLTQHESTHGVVELKARAKPEAAAAAGEDEGGEEKPQEVQMKWNPRAMMSMVPTALLRKRTASALEAQQRAEAVIAGSGMTAASLADEIAPVAPAPAPALAAAAPAAKRFKAAVDLVPDVDGSDDDDDDAAADRPGTAPLFSCGSSRLFSSRAHAGAAAAAPSSAPRPLAPAVDLAPDTDDAGGDGGGDNMDDEFKRFMAGL